MSEKALSQGGWPLRWVLLAALLSFCVVPAAIVGGVLYRNSIETVDTLAEKIIGDVAERVSLDTTQHLAQAHIVFNGLVPMNANELEFKRARQMLTSPEAFETAAFSLTRMSPEVPYLYAGTAQGEFWGVETSRGASGANLARDRKSTRLNSSHDLASRMPSSA